MSNFMYAPRLSGGGERVSIIIVDPGGTRNSAAIAQQPT